MCNPWCNEFVLDCSIHWTKDSDILEVGSLNVNGTPRDALKDHKGLYIGVDLQMGPGVDRIVDVKDLTDVFGPKTFDAVISTGSLEHMADWRVAVWQMSNVLRVGGVLCLTTCCPGFEYHPYPLDNWRFTREQLSAIFIPPMQWLVIEGSPHTRINPKTHTDISAEIAVLAKRDDGDIDVWWDHLTKTEVSHR